jgi:hypothetical protein
MRSRRVLRALVVGALVTGGLPPVALVRSVADPAAPTAYAADGACVDGWRSGSTDPDVSLLDVALLSDGRAVAVGSERRAFGTRRAAVAWWDGAAWSTTLLPESPLDSSLLAVDGRLPDALWAVGFQETRTRSFGLAMRATGSGEWVEDSPPRPVTDAETLSGVDVDPDGNAWAVGERVTPRAVRHALVWQRTPAGWVRHAVPSGPRTALSAVVAIAANDVWAAGSRVGQRGARPMVVHWDGSAWSEVALPLGGGEGSLFAITGSAAGSIWAVGWRREAQHPVPLVLRGDGGGWSVLPTLDTGARLELLTGVSLDAEGQPWVVGTVYLGRAAQYVPLAARWTGQDWQVWPRTSETGRYLLAVAGDPLGSGWAVGKATKGSVRVALCPRPEGGSASPPTVRRDRLGAAGRTWDDQVDERPPRPVRGLPRAPRLDPPPGEPPIVLRDIAAEVGLGASVPSHGAAVADVDRDERPDIFISGHGGPPSLWLWRDGGYQRAAEPFSKIDRHDCAIGRVDAGPWPDLVCTVGADRGVGLKANELWLDPGSGSRVEEAVARGIGDPTGRGRALALFDADGDADLDLFLGNLGLRYDGQPSPNRLFLNDGEGSFTFRPGSGLTTDRGAWCALPRDIDLDGDDDLVVCGYTGSVIASAGIIVYRNDGGRFRNVTGGFGIQPIGEVDGEVADLDRDGRPDIIQLSARRIRVSLWRDDRFAVAWERTLTEGRAVAVGDVDGDGDTDIYLQRGGHTRNAEDAVLLNDGSATTWTTLAVPPPAGGTADDVVALDRDGDGRAEFLVVNGRSAPGPLQLIAADTAPASRQAAPASRQAAPASRQAAPASRQAAPA